ncbi:MAG: nucleotidyltransferase domain-containing protein [Nitrospiria bacterium]
MEKPQVDEILERIVAVLREHYEPEQIILFGSYAHGKPNKDSDIDLLIVKETDKPFFQRLAELRSIVSEYRHGYAFETMVVTHKELKERLKRAVQFFQAIMEKGTVLYAR